MRSKFKSTGQIAISEIMLDQNNYRLGPLDSQIECIEIMFKEFGSKMTKIAGHIARYGLSPKPIVVSKDDQGRWVVRDGNRRITALRLLINPAEAPDQYKRSFQEIKKNSVPGNIPENIDCLTADEATVTEYRTLEHLGPQDGIGQVNWDARANENLRADLEGKLKYPLAGAICEYLEKKGVSEAGKVSISGMQRLFQDTEASKRIGFIWDGQQFYFTAKEDEVLNILKEIIFDFTNKDKKKRVKDIYYPEDRKEYLDKLFETRGLKEPTPLPQPVSPSGIQIRGEKTSNAANIPTKTRPSWDRKRVIKRGMGLSVPESEAKLDTVLVELSSKIDVRKATIAASVLIRLVLERSVESYIKKNNITCKSYKLHSRINDVAKDMKQYGVINKKQLELLTKMSQSEQLISAHTLNAWVHNPNYTPYPREVCTFWDNIYFFLVKCWK